MKYKGHTIETRKENGRFAFKIDGKLEFSSSRSDIWLNDKEKAIKCAKSIIDGYLESIGKKHYMWDFENYIFEIKSAGHSSTLTVIHRS